MDEKRIGLFANHENFSLLAARNLNVAATRKTRQQKK
jgi:hypothetical protein